MPDERLGERACAFVVLATARSSTSPRCSSTSTRSRVAKTVLARAAGARRDAAAHAVGQDPEVRPARRRRRELAAVTSRHDHQPRRSSTAELAAAGRGPRLRRERGRALGGADRGERRVPPELWDELRDRGYLRLAAPVAVRRRRASRSRRYLELLELFSMSHASLRMIVHVANGIWRPMDSHANDDQRERFVMPAVTGEIKVAFTLTEPTAGTGADIRCSVVREGDTYYLTGEKHLITFGTIADYLLTVRAGRGHARHRRHGRADGPAPRRGRRQRARWPRRWACAAPTTATSCSTARRCRSPTGSARRARAWRSRCSGFLGPSRISLAMTCVGLAQRALDLAARVRPAARDVRQEDRRAPGDRVQAGRDGHRRRGRARGWCCTRRRRGSSAGTRRCESAMAKLFASRCSSA